MSADVSHRPERAAAAPPPTGGGAGPMRRFEWCVRSSAYAVMALELLIVLPVALRTGSSTAELGLLLVVITLHVVANVVTLSWALNRLKLQHRGAGWPPRWRLLATIATTVTAVVCVYVVFGTGGTGVAVYVVGLTWAAVAPALHYRTALVGVGVIAVLLSAVLLSTMDGPVATRVTSLLTFIFVAFVLCASVWLSGWMLRVYWELNEARLDSARLAIAEERLRISRDLHDVFGRTLATVAVKSELAAELARRGRAEEAAAEISEVRSIADQAGQEVRRVLRGYREADLAVELQGARSLLAAAGVDCMVNLAPIVISAEATSTLAWVTREAVTNVIKHANATRASITLVNTAVSIGGLGRGPGKLVLTIVNDGAGSAELGSGQGLRGMAERVAEAGGVLHHQRVDGTFTVRVELP
ncbi:MAG TPA: histidine kinase [Propionibacteriaceae bacterium]